MRFLPVTREEIVKRHWNEVDVVLITGDAYVDHPSFGVAVIGRVLENRGYRVGIIAMPSWNDPSSITVFGRPRLFFGVTSGNVDSMVARYTAFKRYRSDDPYAPGGEAGCKPERAVIVYCNLIRATYKDVPIVIGGIESSTRRLAHYDYWSDRVRRSIIEDSRADILVYGMGERQITEIAERLSEGMPPDGIPGTVVISKELPDGAQLLPPEEEVLDSRDAFTEFYRLFYRNQHRVLAQPTGKRYIVHYPPSDISAEELDAVYELPYTREPHPIYKKPIPAFEMIRNSVTAHRGCVAGCSFCSVSLHQGKRIVSRSPESVLNEIETIARDPDFRGHITDIGGPSANMYGFDCSRNWRCSLESCTFPKLCPNLRLRTRDWIDLLDRASSIRRVSNVTVGSGIRYDLFMRDADSQDLLKAVIASHVSGQLKIAPEHTSPRVLRAMRKTPLFELHDFVEMFRDCTSNMGKRQYLLPYLMSCHPGCRIEDMSAMRREIFSLFGFVPHQVQAFIPLPMTLSSAIFYTGIDPLTGEKFPVARDMAERRKQHQLFFANKSVVRGEK
ncbi:MAG: YgiQ family radical SAM protein [bacterium]